MMSKPTPRRWLEFRSLGARVYVYALALLMIGTLVLVPIFLRVTHISHGDLYKSFGVWMTEQVFANAKTQADLQRELERVTRATSMDATVHDREGHVIVSSAHPPLARLSANEGAHGASLPAWNLIQVDLPEGALVTGTIVWRRDPLPSILVFLAAVGVAVFSLVSLAALPAARSIARPLRELRDVARRFGEGALSARARSTRADEIGDLARSFDEMAARIEASRRAERELLAGISHELRTPLARIRVALDLVEGGDAAIAAAHFPGIRGDLTEVERLLEDVLTAARLDLAMPQDAFPGLQKDVVLASELVGVIARRFEANHPERVLDVEAEGLGEAAVDVDATLLGRALQNLLDNAAKYSHAPVRLEAALHGERLTLRVIDEGIGISEADLALVFTPFFRGDPSRTRETGGVGLGLALARRIARAHGGDVTIDSRLGEGTTVSMELPVLGIQAERV
ncbi:periplasmic sensor signal transduction histidine kinase [Minicystis rosea]|nr:periplasmic sensor signal transduction histidine kinase [Minicystis rosea]